MVIPIRGWGAVDLAEADKALGWAGPNPDLPGWQTEKHPEWSRRSTKIVQALHDKLDRSKANVDVCWWIST